MKKIIRTSCHYLLSSSRLTTDLILFTEIHVDLAFLTLGWYGRCIYMYVIYNKLVAKGLAPFPPKKKNNHEISLAILTTQQYLGPTHNILVISFTVLRVIGPGALAKAPNKWSYQSGQRIQQANGATRLFI